MNVSKTLHISGLLLAIIASVATLSDQYDARQDTGADVARTMVAAPSHSEATDQQNYASHRDKLKVDDTKPLGRRQVDWGLGQRRKDSTQHPGVQQRRRRNYQSTFALLQPSVYQLQRPYVIPIWGSAGRLPLYFPPQPVYFDDPRRSYLPPMAYLPPDTRTTTTIGYEESGEDVMGEIPPLNNRNLGEFDEAPIWDIEPPAIRPLPPRRPNLQDPIQSRPTRRPGARTTTSPPLVHRSENTTFTDMQRPNLLRPLNNGPAVISAQNPIASDSFRPAASERTTDSGQPSRCVWAIISCCTGSGHSSGTQIAYNCFEQLGCVGAFWDKSPCDSDFAKAAIDVALKYYQQN